MPFLFLQVNFYTSTGFCRWRTFNCSCPAQSLSFQTEVNHSESTYIVSIAEASSTCGITNFISSETSDQRVSIDNIQTLSHNSDTVNTHLSN